MLEEKDLQAIAQIMDQKLAQQKREIMGETKELLSQQKREIMQEVGVLIENEVTPKFNLLADLEASVKKLNREVAQLKKAQ